jgi:mandelate racemase
MAKDDLIEELKTAVVTIPLAEPFAAGRWRLDAVFNIVVQVKSSSGALGYGYAFVFRQADAQTILSAVLAFSDIVENSNPLDSAHLHENLTSAANWVGASGAAMSAIGAIDLAVWDLKGKLLGVPVHALLGSTKTKIPAYASGGSFDKHLDALEREVRSYLDSGFKAVKIKLPPDAKEACKRIEACRSWVGDSIDMLYDSNQQQTYKTALEIARCCYDNEAYWYEEPLPHWQLRQYAELRRGIQCRLSMGETFYGQMPFFESVLLEATDVLMPNLHKIGGVSAWMRIAGLAQIAGIPISSHTMPELSAHVMAATPNREMLEYLNWWGALYENPYHVEDGCIMIPSDGVGFCLEPSKTVRDAFDT